MPPPSDSDDDSDDDRRSLTPVEGLPINSPIARLAEQWDKNLRAHGQRLGSIQDAQGKELERLAMWRVAMCGLNDDNGVIGNLRRDVGAGRRLLAAVFVLALGSIGAAAAAVDAAGESRGAAAAQLRRTTTDVERCLEGLDQVRADYWRQRFPPATPAMPGDLQ